MHFVVHGLPEVYKELSAQLGTESITALEVTQPDPLDITFEKLFESIVDWERMFLEPDGSFVWSGVDWQLDGQINDGGATVDHIELKGSCPLRQWQTFVQVLGGPQKLLIQLVREGIFVSATYFSEIASHE